MKISEKTTTTISTIRPTVRKARNDAARKPAVAARLDPKDDRITGMVEIPNQTSRLLDEPRQMIPNQNRTTSVDGALEGVRRNRLR